MNSAGVALDLDRSKLDIATICALEIESTAVEASSHEMYNTVQFRRIRDDTNVYMLGRVGQHCVVLICLPSYRKASSSPSSTIIVDTFANHLLFLL